MKYRALPTWLMTRAFNPRLRADHPWKNRKFALGEWHNGQTRDCKAIDYAIWVWGACLIYLTLILTGVIVLPN